MAYTSTQAHTQKTSIWASVSSGISTFFAALVEANSRAVEVQQLQAMSDRQLADIGLDRQDIVSRVFADKVGI